MAIWEALLDSEWRCARKQPSGCRAADVRASIANHPHLRRRSLSWTVLFQGWFLTSQGFKPLGTFPEFVDGDDENTAFTIVPDLRRRRSSAWSCSLETVQFARASFPDRPDLVLLRYECCCELDDELSGLNNLGVSLLLLPDNWMYN
jgi:hypothetical protein